MDVRALSSPFEPTSGRPATSGAQPKELSQPGEASSASVDRKTPAITRVDAAHTRAGQARVPDGEPAEIAAPQAEGRDIAAADASPPDWLAPEPLARQAAELAAILKERQRELDRRETQLNAVAARLDEERRESRLWLVERRQSLEDEGRLLVEERAAVERRASEVSAREAALDRSMAELAEQGRQQARAAARREEDLLVRQQALDLREATLAAAEDRLQSRQAELEREFDDWRRRILESAAGEQAAAARREEAEKLLQQRLEDIARREDILSRETSRREQTWSEEAGRLADDARRLEADRARERELLRQREAALTLREASLFEIQQEVERSLRQTLQTRLAVEQTWAKLRGAAPAAELSLEISRARNLLADQFGHESKSLARRRKALEELARRLHAQLASLGDKRRRWRAWCARRRAEIEQQAAAAARGRCELEHQQRRLAERETQWLRERDQLLGRLRRLADTVPPGD